MLTDLDFFILIIGFSLLKAILYAIVLLFHKNFWKKVQNMYKITSWIEHFSALAIA